MTENDYIAEYVKEKRPEIIDTLDFATWKLGRCISDIVNETARALRGIVQESSKISELMSEEEGDPDERD